MFFSICKYDKQKTKKTRKKALERYQNRSEEKKPKGEKKPGKDIQI